MKQKRRLFACLEENSFMEEEWMRDRALLRDLLQKAPQASPRELAQATGRQVALGQKMAQAAAGRRPGRSRALVFSFASAPCALLPLGPTRRNPHRGDASVSTRASGTHARPPGPALLSATRSGPTSRRSSLAPVQSNHLEAPAEKRVYLAPATGETTAH
jgi:hypothetical protein